MRMECGEIDFARLLHEQQGKRLNMNFVGMYWEQVSNFFFRKSSLTNHKLAIDA